MLILYATPPVPRGGNPSFKEKGIPREKDRPCWDETWIERREFDTPTNTTWNDFKVWADVLIEHLINYKFDQVHDLRS